MQHRWILASSFFLSLSAMGSGAVGWDQSRDFGREVALERASSARVMEGIVRSVDPQEGHVSLKNANFGARSIRIVVERSTRIEKHGASIALADVAVGDPVSVEYRRLERGNVARAIQVLASPVADRPGDRTPTASKPAAD